MTKVGLIAGGGRLPLAVRGALVDQGTAHCVIRFKGQEGPDHYDHEVGLGQVGKVVSLLRDAGCDTVVFAGSLQKPSLFDLRVDISGAKLLKRAYSKHDNELLSIICDYMLEQNFTVKGAHEICPDLVAPAGFMAGQKISDDSALTLGAEVVKTLGQLDIGQAVIVKDGVVLGVEAIEGTSALIERCASLRGKTGKGGVLVKMAKPQQDLRVDLPTIGLETITQLAGHHYDGLIVEAGKTLILDRTQVAAVAAEKGLFIYAEDSAS